VGIRHNIAKFLLKPELKGRQPLIPRWLTGKAIWKDWSTENAITNGLKASVWVYRCADKKARAAASVPWNVEEWDGSEWQPIENHPIEMLLSKANPHMTGNRLSQIMTMHLNLGGNAVWHKVLVNGMPVELWPLPPDKISPIPSRTDWVAQYKYTVDGYENKIPAEEIIHFQFTDPANPYWGLAPLKAASRQVDTDSEAIAWNKVALQNRAVADGVFTFKGVMNDEQWRAAREQVREQHQGSDNARAPWVLGSDASWQQMSLSPAEMDFLNSRKFSREEICAAFGVPTLLVGGDAASTYANYEQARKAFWEDEVVPFLDEIREALNLALIPHWDPESVRPDVKPNLRIVYDVSNVPALQENFDDKVKTANTLWRMGVPFNDINQRLELGFEDVEGGDKPRQTGGLFQASNKPKGKKALSDEQKTMYWKSFDRDRRRWEKEVEKLVHKRFTEESIDIITAYEKQGRQEALATIKEQENEWMSLFDGFYTAIIEYFGQEQGERLEKSTAPQSRKFRFDPFGEGVRAFIGRFAGKKITNILETTRQRITRQIDEGMAAGETVDVISRRLRDTYELMSVNRSMTISRTETGAAANFGHREGAMQAEEQFGLEIEKEWLSSRDDRVRDGTESDADHDIIDGERVAINERYSNGLMYPGDPSGPAEEVINCRCNEIHHVLNE